MSDILDLLILGAGWSSSFLIPLLRARNLAFAATTRDGRDVAGSSTLKWAFDPNGSKSQFSSLPASRAVLITFPLTGLHQSTTLVTGYKHTHEKLNDVHFIQLGSSGIWQGGQQTTVGSGAAATTTSTATLWTSRRSAYDTKNARAIAEDELLRLGGCVMNLAGLWGGSRDARHWVERVAKTKEEVRGKRSLHMVHGEDVARGILAVVGNWRAAGGQRWLLTDGFVYDWWSLFVGWADVRKDEKEGERPDREPSPQAKWVLELMREDGVRALPRSMEVLGRCYDSQEFWDTFKLTPLKARI